MRPSPDSSSYYRKMQAADTRWTEALKHVQARLRKGERLGVENARVTVVDKGALDCTIKARVECAVFRSCDASAANIPWGGAIR